MYIYHICVEYHIWYISSVCACVCVWLYDFRADHLVLYDQLGGQSLGKTLSPFSASLSCCGSCIQAKLCEISSFHVKVSISVVLVQVTQRYHGWSFSVVSRRHNHIGNVPVLWLLQSSEVPYSDLSTSTRQAFLPPWVYCHPCAMRRYEEVVVRVPPRSLRVRIQQFRISRTKVGSTLLSELDSVSEGPSQKPGVARWLVCGSYTRCRGMLWVNATAIPLDAELHAIH